MQVLPVLIILSLACSAIGLIAFIWATRNGQWNDLEASAQLPIASDKDTTDA